jgi:hypothetical protein
MIVQISGIKVHIKTLSDFDSIAQSYTFVSDSTQEENFNYFFNGNTRNQAASYFKPSVTLLSFEA